VRLPAAAIALAVSAPCAAAELSPVPPADLCVTHGALGRRQETFAVDAPAMRAVAPGRWGHAAELRFVYLGPTQETSTLASGGVREQLGLKLRARDGCNVVYVMWRLGRAPRLSVSVKRNLLFTTSEGCGARGYREVPVPGAVVPAVLPGEKHTLAASLDWDELAVRVDGKEVFRGRVGLDALLFDGPAGVRTDNVRIEAELRAAPGDTAAPSRCAAD
jgi:hypothetical protein